MRWLSDGFVSYTYEQASAALALSPDHSVFVAPNSLYTDAQLASGIRASISERADLLYVGRFATAKKIDTLIAAFAASRAMSEGARLVLVGAGDTKLEAMELARRLGVEHRVHFREGTFDFDELSSLYSSAFASASPGFAGLGLTQSLGFGVPVLVSRDEPHSPEVELDSTGQLRWFATGDNGAFALAIDAAWNSRSEVPIHAAAAHVRRTYSAERMAHGLRDALLGHIAERGDEADEPEYNS